MKTIRIITIVLCCALILSFNISANTTTLTNYIGYNHIYKDSQGVIILSKTDLKVVPLRLTTKMTSLAQATMVGFTTTGREPLLIFIPESYSDKITYTLHVAETSYPLGWNQNNVITENAISTTVGSLTGTHQPTYFNAYFIFYQNMTGLTGTQFFQSYTYNSNYIVYDSVNNTVGNITGGTVDPNYSLDDAIGSNGISADELITAIDTAIQNNENIINLAEKIDILINIGSNYNNIDNNLISNLGNAEDQLSNAEDAIQNKSQSLVDKVASQWTANKGVASSFLTTITPATSAIGTVTDDFFEAIPEEIKNAVITIMLIVFIGWLIGRVEG